MRQSQRNPPSVLPLARRGEQIENVVWFDNAYQVAPYNSSSEKFLLPISRPLRGNELIRQARTQVMDRTARTHGLPELSSLTLYLCVRH